VPHNSFAIRFSNLVDVENACREDDESRAVRTIDWMTARINRRCQIWVQDMEALGAKETSRTPWWDELRRCAEGDFVPSKTEGWNHPVARMSSTNLLCLTQFHPTNNSHSGRIYDGAKSISGNHCPSFPIPPVSVLGRYHILEIYLDRAPSQFTTLR
jgi:hypothetical protein